MRRITCGCGIKCLAVAGLTALAGTSAQAGLTPVNAAGGTELGHAAILNHAYGGSFNATGADYTNGSVTALRLQDSSSVGAMTNLLLSSDVGNADQCWTNGVVSARAIARFGGFEQSLGIIEGDSGAGSFNKLFDVAGYGLDVSGSIANLDLCGKTFRFARGGGGETFTSLDLDNFAAADQMVSYKLTSHDGRVKYVLFFEDAGVADNSDFDFNDLVVEITASAPNAVPLPPAVWGGLAVLLTGGAWNARRRLARLLT